MGELRPRVPSCRDLAISRSLLTVARTSLPSFASVCFLRFAPKTIVIKDISLSVSVFGTCGPRHLLRAKANALSLDSSNPRARALYLHKPQISRQKKKEKNREL